MNQLAKHKPATYGDLAALPANIVGEIVHGVLYGHPRPAPRHAIAAHKLGKHLGNPFDDDGEGPGGWIFMVEPELHLGPHVLVPDIAGWKRERLTLFPDTAFIEAPPDWVAEILSPSTQALDRTDKLAIHSEYGVGHCWYVDPIARTLEVFARASDKWLLAAALKNSNPVTQPPFEAHTFALDVLWVD